MVEEREGHTELMAEHADEHRPVGRGTSEHRALRIALVANALLMFFEIAGGIAFGSLALLADAGHLLTDVLALGLSLLALHLAEREPTPRHTFGFERAEVLAAQVNALLLGGVTVWIVVEAINRWSDPVQVEATGMLVVALIALLVNAASALVLARAAGESLNMRAAYLHLATDAAGSLAAIVAALLILGWQVERADTVASLVTAGFVAFATIGLVRDTTHVLMEGAPRGLDAGEIEFALTSEDGVLDVHHLHLWSLASDVPALSAHVVLAGHPSFSEAQGCSDLLKGRLSERFGITNITFELEDEGQGSARPAGRSGS